MKSIEELNTSRCSDIRVLLKARNARKYAWNSLEVRNFLFVYAVCCSTLQYEDAFRELYELKNQLPDYSKNFFNSLVKNLGIYNRFYIATGKCRYQFTNKKLIDLLNIKYFEMQELDSIISDKERERRENLLIDEELEHLRIENEIEESIENYENEKEIRHQMVEAKVEDIIFRYKDPFISDSH